MLVIQAVLTVIFCRRSNLPRERIRNTSCWRFWMMIYQNQMKYFKSFLLSPEMGWRLVTLSRVNVLYDYSSLIFELRILAIQNFTVWEKISSGCFTNILYAPSAFSLSECIFHLSIIFWTADDEVCRFGQL